MGHAYVVLGAKELSNGLKLVKMRNPWGKERYQCDYSDESALWTPGLRKEAGATSEAVDEGIFFMTLDDYLSQGHTTVISYDTTGWFRDHFLMLNDPKTEKGAWSWCGETCTRHIVEVTSAVDQVVFVTGHIWEPRSYPSECKNKNKVHSIYMDGASAIDMFREGSKQLDPITFEAGMTKKFILEFDWARQGITADWSLTA